MAWDLQLTRALATTDLAYRLAGMVHAPAGESLEGASVRVRSLDTGWTEEVFVDTRGAFHLALDLSADSAHDYELSACDGKGRVVWCSPVRIRHQNGAEIEGEVDLPTSEPRAPVDYASVLEPPWTVCAQQIRHCLHLAATVAQATGRKREELLQYVHAQERYAEQAHKENDRALYRECLENLDKYATYLEDLRLAAEPRPLQNPPPAAVEEDPPRAIDRVRTELAAVWKEVRTKGRGDLEPVLKQVAAQAQGLGRRSKADPGGALQEARRLRAEVESVKQQIETSGVSPASDSLSKSLEARSNQRQVEQ
jgi:hypothetical protein